MVNTEYVFSDPARIYFVMKFARGGDLFNHLKKQRRFKEEQAKFYISNICQAIGFLHSNEIIHRDIRPENILMQEDGYLCLSNFGVAKKLEKADEVAQSYFGDLDYQSPEMLLEEGHSYPTDWWSVGILAYQFVVGIPPFYDSNLQKQGEKIVNGDIHFPNEL